MKTREPTMAVALSLTPLARRGPSASERLRRLFETEAGRLPWRKDFGLDLRWLEGEPLTTSALARAEEAIREAIGRNLPDAQIEELTLSVHNEMSQRSPARERGIPIAEAALLPYGAGARLTVSMRIQIDGRVETALVPLAKP